MRGRLINPFLLSIAQLDTETTAAVGGYDPVFRETVLTPDASPRGGSDARVDKSPVDVKVQIEPEMLDQLQMMMSGQSPKQTFAAVAHFLDLDAAGLVDAQGLATLRKGDRLVSIKTVDGDVIQQITTPPGLYITQIKYMGFGLGRKRNLLFVLFEERELGARSQGG